MTQTTYDQPPDNFDDMRLPKPGMVPVPYRPDEAGAFRERRYQQIFEDHADYGLGAAFPDRERHRAFDDSLGSLGSFESESEPYGDSIFLFHSNRRGVRVSIQAPRKIFFIVLVVAIVILAKPGLVDAIQLFINSLQATH